MWSCWCKGDEDGLKREDVEHHRKSANDHINEAIRHLGEIAKHDDGEESLYYWNCIDKLTQARYKVEEGYRE